LIEFLRAGSLPAARARGVMAGINEVLRLGGRAAIARIDGDGQFKPSLEAVRKHLRWSRANRILVSASNDPSALGALRAFEEAGRAAHCAVVGHNAEPEARSELRNPRTRLIGSVAHCPEKYGEGLSRLALDILAHKPVPPACFIKHQLISPENVDHFYPNDVLLGMNTAAV
jgi:ribose transport system substrate-binding protein